MFPLAWVTIRNSAPGLGSPCASENLARHGQQGMNWIGKITGGLIGLMLFRNLLGGIIGAFIGHFFFDERRRFAAFGGDARQVQASFFRATFLVMGHVSKADGRVSEQEIRMARAVMDHMNLAKEQTDEAMRLFTEGKQPDFDLDREMEKFRRDCHMRRDLLRMFIEIQLQAALADGLITDAERRVLERIGSYLHIPPWEIRQLEALIRAAQRRYYGGAQDYGQRRTEPPRDALKDAYEVLAVDAKASDADVKKAYRRLMSQHHPDKLASKGLPEEMMKIAQEKAQEITAAYDLVKEARRIK